MKKYGSLLLTLTLPVLLCACSCNASTTDTNSTTMATTNLTEVATSSITEETTIETSKDNEPTAYTGLFVNEIALNDNATYIVNIKKEEDTYHAFLYRSDDSDMELFQTPVMTGNMVTEGDNSYVYFEYLPDVFKIKQIDNDTLDIEVIEQQQILTPSPLTGKYKRIDNINAYWDPFEIPVTPEYVADKNCEVELDSTLGEAIRIELMLPDNAFLSKSTLESVTTLRIWDTRITSLKGVSALSNLNQLSISNGYIDDISELAKISTLESIDISWCYIDTIPDLSTCSNLNSLSLAKNLITDISPINKLSKLKYLCLVDNKITDISPLANAADLIMVAIDNNCILNYESICNNTKLVDAINNGSNFKFEDALEVEIKVKEILANITYSSQSPIEKEIEIYKYVIDNTEYDESPFNCNAYGYRAIMTHKGVCGNYAEAFCLLCRHAGIEAYTCDSDTHEWNIVKLDGKYYQCDALWDENSFEWTYFNRSTAYMINQGHHFHDLIRYPFCKQDMNLLDYYRYISTNN